MRLANQLLFNNSEGGVTMENEKMIKNNEMENKEENKPGIVEVEVNCDNSLVFFGTCHCSNGSRSEWY